MHILTSALVFLFFLGMIGTVLVIILTFLDDLREISDTGAEHERPASAEPAVRTDPVEVA
jgi:hypothetical protein